MQRAGRAHELTMWRRLRVPSVSGSRVCHSSLNGCHAVAAAAYAVRTVRMVQHVSGERAVRTVHMV